MLALSNHHKLVLQKAGHLELSTAGVLRHDLRDGSKSPPLNPQILDDSSVYYYIDNVCFVFGIIPR